MKRFKEKDILQNISKAITFKSSLAEKDFSISHYSYFILFKDLILIL